MNRAELRGLRAAAEALNPNVGERFAIVEGDRVRAFDLSEEKADNWRETFFPGADIVRMAELFAEKETVEGMTPEEFAALSPAEQETARGIEAVSALPDHECIPEMCPDCNPLPVPDEDESDMVCPECGDPDCSRPFGHLTEADERSVAEDIAYHEAKDEGRIRRRK